MTSALSEGTANSLLGSTLFHIIANNYQPLIVALGTGNVLRYLALLLFFFSSFTHAVGWFEISKENNHSLNIEVKLELVEKRECYKVNVGFPDQIYFKEIGTQEFTGVFYRIIRSKAKGWQVMPKGTLVSLATVSQDKVNTVESLCIGSDAIENAYLSAHYWASKAPPMILLIDLGSYNN